MLSVAADRVVGAIDSEKGAPREWQVLGRLERTAIGLRGAGGVTSVRRREPAGCLLYGPYWQLPSGGYQLIFRCRPGKPRLPSEPVLGVEVIAMNRVQLAWLDLTAAELQGETGSLDFTVPPNLGLGAGDEARLEFRFFHMGNADLTIIAVDLQGTENDEMFPAPPRMWRMLGRLERTAIGKRRAEGVTVRHTERAGCLLDGGRPFLQLPEGHYRLEFRCDAGIPQMSAQPVLGVEVRARHRWQDSRWWSWNSLLGRSPPGGIQLAWRDFTSAELSAGSASFDFKTPKELALEGGQDIVLGLRLLYLGNAGLAIRAVDLRQVSAAKAASSPPREWRLLGRLAKGRIGRIEADCVTVRHSDPAGCLLYGGRPRLQLPMGRYRLSFCCQARQPRKVSQPVLRVEVIARTRGLRTPTLRLIPPLPFPAKAGGSGLQQAGCEFTSEALMAEWASLDFDVPAELSCESKGEVGFEFRFLHLGNAELTVSAVNLHEISGEALPANSPPRLVSPQRTRVLIVGNCQAQTVYEALARSAEFNLRLDTKYHFVGLQQNLHELGKTELENSDVLLVQDIRDWEHYPLKPYIRDDVQIIKFPLLHFASLWPFDHYNGPGDKEAYEREWPNLTFLYHDGLLARLRKEIPDREQRLLAYRTLSVDGIINFTRLHDFERRRLAAMDKQFGCEIGHFILENFQRRRLFYTTNHPNGQIIGMLMRYLLRQLEMDRGYRPNSSLDHLKRLQVPVHPKVAKALGVKWASENTKYLYGGERITWETYVRRYIEHYG
ncbi:MAG TPA: WcbI family polysaccharide biosynthesis putative acetyltransferase [Stellaceae bacterium]|nr:WcbI family polysaccharide biosynthesis putative acetyltransferase [Stellaceae bacterium]